MKTCTTILILWLSLLGAQADFRYYSASLDGHQVRPAAADSGLSPSAATGLLNLVVDETTGLFQIDVVIRGLQGNYIPCFLPQTICSGAHFHLGASGEIGSTHIYNTRNDLWVNEAGNNTPMPGDWTYAATGQIFITDLNNALTHLDNENVYFNLHSEYLLSGEIRGQVIPSSIPEPNSANLLFLAMLSLGIMQRRAKEKIRLFRR